MAAKDRGARKRLLMIVLGALAALIALLCFLGFLGVLPFGSSLGKTFCLLLTAVFLAAALGCLWWLLRRSPLPVKRDSNIAYLLESGRPSPLEEPDGLLEPGESLYFSYPSAFSVRGSKSLEGQLYITVERILFQSPDHGILEVRLPEIKNYAAKDTALQLETVDSAGEFLFVKPKEAVAADLMIDYAFRKKDERDYERTLQNRI